MCEGKEADLRDELVPPAHHIAKKGGEECSGKCPLLLAKGTKREPKQREYHSSRKRHRNEVQNRKNEENENDYNVDVNSCHESRDESQVRVSVKVKINNRAIDGARTRDLRLGKPKLYQLSYYRK